MKVIGLMNEKGGQGKTTIASHIAAGLAIRGHKVVLIDADPQASATANFGIAPKPSLHDLLVRDMDWQDAMLVVSPEVYEVPEQPSAGKLFIVPGHVETRVISELTSDPYVFLDKVELLETSVDYVIVDTNPTPSLLHGIIYMAMDAVLYPSQMEYLAFMGLINSIAHRQKADKRRLNNAQSELAMLGIVPTMFREQTLEHRENLEELQQKFPNQVWNPIHLRTIWAEASRLHRPVWGLMPNSKAAAEAWELIDRFEQEVQHVIR